MALAAQAIEDDAADVELRVECTVAQHHRRGAAGESRGVEDEHNGKAKHLGEMSGASGLAFDRVPIEQTHDAFDQGEVGTAGGMRKRSDERLARKHPTVEVPAGLAGSEGVIGRVNVVRTCLEGGHAKTS